MINRRKIVLLVLLLLVLCSFNVYAAPMGNLNLIEVKTIGEIKCNGDLQMDMTWNFPDTATYTQLKANYPNPYLIIRDLTSSRSDMEFAEVEIRFNDARRSLTVNGLAIGYAVCRHNKWEIFLGDNASLVYRDDRLLIIRQILNFGNMIVVNDNHLQLPAASDYIEFNRNTQFLVYKLPFSPGEGETNLNVEIEVKDRIMSAAYKAYGLKELEDGEYWVAKLKFKNKGNTNIEDLQIRYKLGEYSSWSPPHRYSLIVPTGSVIDLYYPIISQKVTSLKTPTPVNLEVEYSYSDDSGEEFEDYLAERLSILGINQIEYSKFSPEETSGSWLELFSNTPLFAAFVTHLDEPIKKFAGMASQYAGGVATADSDKEAYAFCEALFNLEVKNNMVYQTPSGFLTEYSPGQDIKYPRDVLRDKSGTCLDLAILYASICEAVGLNTNLVIIPGHAFPVIQMPSGDLLPIETTCIGGEVVGRDNFDKALQLGFKNMQQLQPGRYIFINVQQMHQMGIVSPELPPLPSNILQEWGYRIPAKQQVPQAQNVNPTNTNPENRVPDNQQQKMNKYNGTYQGKIYNETTGDEIGYQMFLMIQENQVTGEVRVESGFVGTGDLKGRIQDNILEFTVYTQVDNQEVPIQYQVMIQNNRLNGRFYVPLFGYSGSITGNRIN